MVAPETIALLGLAAGTAGVIDSIAGGGGLITVPALLAAGLPPVNALATNKLQSVFSQIMSTWRYARRGLIEFRNYGLMAAGIFIASAIGAFTGPAYLGRCIEAPDPVPRHRGDALHAALAAHDRCRDRAASVEGRLFPGRRRDRLL